MMLKVIHLLLLVHVFSCASSYKRPESFAQKMNRYRARISSNSIPRLTVNTNQFRKPASIPQQVAPKNRLNLLKSPTLLPKNKNIENIHFSNKRIYFLSLLEQYRSFRSYLPQKTKTPSINSCPGLHGAFLEYMRSHPSPLPGRQANFNPKGALLALPLSHNPQSKILKDIKENKRKKQLFQKALHIHAEKIYSELVELCQYGSSNNYYAYENLMNHIKRHPQKFPVSPKNLQTLIKTTIFVNKILLSAIKQQSPSVGRSPAALSQESNPWIEKAMNKNHLKWFKQYLHIVK